MNLRQSFSKLPLLYGQLVNNSIFKLSDDDVRHCQVLRKQLNDFVLCTDGKGLLIAGEISVINKKEVLIEIKQRESIPKNSLRNFHLIIAPTKQNERMEWLVEKCVEMGIEEISFALCKNSEKSHLNIERINKICIAAIKQSRQCYLPMINEPKSFEEIVKNIEKGEKAIAFCSESSDKIELKTFFENSVDNVHIAIGPEGDFTDEEIKTSEKYGFKKISLGSSILRTETAGLFVCATLRSLA